MAIKTNTPVAIVAHGPQGAVYSGACMAQIIRLINVKQLLVQSVEQDSAVLLFTDVLLSSVECSVVC